jgi:hypothetical protein
MESYKTPEEFKWIDAELDKKEASSRLTDVLKNPEKFQDEFQHIGVKLAISVKEVMEYEACSRKALEPHTLNPGEIVKCNKLDGLNAYAIDKDLDSIVIVAEGAEFSPPDAEITSFLSVKEPTLAELSRLQDKGRHELIYHEDNAFFKLLRKAAGEPTTFNTFDEALLLILNEFSRRRLSCDTIFIPRGLLTANIAKNVYNNIDPVSKKCLLSAGYVGTFGSSMLMTTAETQTYDPIQPGEIFGVANKAYLGGMPVRVDLFSERVWQAVDGKKSYGWFWYELLSMFITNPNAIVYGTIK